MSIVIVKSNNILTRSQQALGFSEGKMSRFPSTTVSFNVFKFPNGKYRHGVPAADIENRKKIQDSLLSGEDLDSELGKTLLKNWDITLPADETLFNLDNPTHLLNFYILKASGDIAVEGEAENRKETELGNTAQYIITTTIQDNSNKFESLKQIAKATSKLEELSEKRHDYLIGIAKHLAPNGKQIKTLEQAYIHLSEVIKGKFDDNSEQRGSNRFLASLEIKPEIIMISGDVKEAMHRSIIWREGGKYINGASGTTLGITEDQVINFFLKDENQEELGLNKSTDQDFSIRKQLAKRRAQV